MEKGLRFQVQRMGKFLSAMVMPNIGAFIAWGLITALFISTGWLPNTLFAGESFEPINGLVDPATVMDGLVEPMIFFMLPLLIAFSGGKLVHGHRGSVIAVVATLGVVQGASIPMFLGAMIMAPLAAYILKFVDRKLEDHIPSGFEMLVNNFTLGIIGAGLAMLGIWGVGPIVEIFTNLVSNVVEAIVDAGFIPIVSIIVEPAKVVFLNNALNHGLFTPLGGGEVAEVGKSILFLIETNPGPGLGVLIAYWVFGKGFVKSSTPGTIIIHFFGGIHEVYFPYILMKPVLVLAVIAGGASGLFIFDIFDVGLVGPASPGSILALTAMTAKGSYIGMFLGVLVSTAVSFLVASFFIRRDDANEAEFEAAQEQMIDLKGKKGIMRIAFACDAGMGSSAMGASALKSKFKKASVKVDVIHCALEDIPKDIQLVVTHRDLAARARLQVPNAEIVTITNFVGAPEYDQLVEKLK